MPIEFNLGRDREKDAQEKAEYLENHGWNEISDFSRIKINPLTWVDVDSKTGSLFKIGEDGKRLLDASPASCDPTWFVTTQYIYIPLVPLTFWIINRIESGHLVGVSEYE